MMSTESPPQADAKSRFVDAVSNFRGWADGYPENQRSAEWEADYDRWPELTRAYCDVLDAGQPDSLDRQTIEQLLYVLARDNEGEVIKDELILRPAHLFMLAKAAGPSSEADAKWQIADALGSVEIGQEQVEPFIENLLRDADEYVSRRALIALTRRGSENLEIWAVRAWNTGHEYQKMAALEALAAHKSPLLKAHLDLAEADGQQHLSNLAKKIRARNVVT